MNDAIRQQKIEALHRKYGGYVYDLCLRILKDPSGAEDAVQETFLNVFRTPSLSYDRESYLPWLYRIATNVCLKTIEKRRQGTADSLDSHSELSGPRHDPIRQIHVRKVLENLVGDLDERGQQLLISHYIWGMDQSQTADLLGISRRAVVKRLTALRKKASRLFKEKTDAE